MPIQCRTGCQDQVNYEPFHFSDGFVYFLPKNLDDSIHDCKNLRTPARIHRVIAKEDGKIVREFDVPIRTWSPEEAHFQDIQDNEGIQGPNGIQNLTPEEWKDLFHASPNQYYQEYSNVAWKNIEPVSLNIDLCKDFRSIMDSMKKKIFHERDSIKKSLINIQMRCILFPTPFITKEMISDIIDLSNHYLMLNDFESAIRARLIQEKISHNQTENILELVKKQNDFKKTDDELIIEFNLSVKELRDKYYRKVENVIKSFIRKKYLSMNDFKNDFPKFYEKANNLRENSTSNIERTNDDVMEYLSFGSCVKILKDKKSDKDNPWNEIEYDIINSAYYVVDRRNEIEHDSDDNLDKRISKESKVLGYIYSKKIIEFFEKLDYV
tara:strand:+ start:114 stop:1256 length:1143 start_codon:yes stop_codon:yes gene_type:complete